MREAALNGTLTEHDGARNTQRAELCNLLAGVEAAPRASIGSPAVAAQRNRLRASVRAWLTLAAVAMLVAATAAAREGGELQPEVDEVLALKPNAANGAKIFAYCASCHDSPANGLPDGWVPSIAGQHARYLAKQLTDYRHSVRWDARMEPVAKGHGLRGLQDIADVVDFVASQPSGWSAPRPGPPDAGEDLTFYRNHCVRCHGSTGQGNGERGVPRIGGQNFAYLLRQMHDVVDGRRPNMRRQHLQPLEGLDVVQLVGLSRYVSRLGAGVPSRAPGLSSSNAPFSPRRSYDPSATEGP